MIYMINHLTLKRVPQSDTSRAIHSLYSPKQKKAICSRGRMQGALSGLSHERRGCFIRCCAPSRLTQMDPF